MKKNLAISQQICITCTTLLFEPMAAMDMKNIVQKI